MTNLERFVGAVPTANQTAYGDRAAEASAMLRELSVRRMAEAWADDAPDGLLTHLPRSVLANADEAVVFSWIGWPSKVTGETGWRRFRAQWRSDHARLPFDGRRMSYGASAPILEA